MNEKAILQSLFAQAGITINGDKPWDIQVHNDQFYVELLKDAELAIGETYVDGWWDCQSLDAFFFHILKSDLEKKALSQPSFWRSALKQWMFKWAGRIVNFQTTKNSTEVGKKHYDIGNDLYEIMLDKRLVYTCAYWKGVNSLEEAQEKKLSITCKKLLLRPGMRILDIGCGFGSLAKYAAENFGVSVVGITISQNQFTLAQKVTAHLPIEIRFQDYRDLLKSNEKFDRVVSLGMFEHVGYQNYSTYMKVVSHCLKDEGLFLLHTIGCNSSRKTTNKWINAYIFPHGQLPTVTQIGESIENIFVMEDWENFGIYYDKTLMAWHENFNKHWDKLKNNYDERFKRMWNFYLLSCAGSFRARENQLWQIVLSKKGLLEGYQRPVDC